MARKNIYANEDEKYVVTTVLYANASKALFYDKAAKTDKVAKTDLEELFLKGVTVHMSGTYYKPVCLNTSGLIANDGTSTAVTFTAA